MICPNCHCDFSASSECIHTDGVYCPSCNSKIQDVAEMRQVLFTVYHDMECERAMKRLDEYPELKERMLDWKIEVKKG